MKKIRTRAILNTLSVMLIAGVFSFTFGRGFQQPTYSVEDSLRIEGMVRMADSLKNINYRRAYTLCTSAIEQARKTGSPYLIKSSLYEGALLDWLDGGHKEALKKCFESLKISQALNDTHGVAHKYELMSLIHLYRSDYDSALYYDDIALEKFTALKDTAQILKIYGFKAIVYNQQADYIKAKENLLSTALIKRQFETTNWSVLNLPGSREINQKYYEESLINAKESLKEFPVDSPPSLSKRFAFHNVGLAYLSLEKPDSALLYFKKSDAVAKELNVDAYWNEQARAYMDLNLYDSAIWAIRKAITNALDHGTRINQSTSYSFLGKAYRALGDGGSAINAYRKSLNLDREMGHRNSQVNTMNWMAETAIGNHQLAYALAMSDSSLALAEKIGARNGILRTLEIRYKIFKLLGNYEQALKIKERETVLSDSIEKGEVQLNMAKLDLFNEVEFKKLEISELNKQQELVKANLKNRTLVMILVSIVTLFIIVLLVLNYLRTRRLVQLNNQLNEQQKTIQKQNKKLEKSNKEKEVLLGEIHHRVKNNLQTIYSLLNIQQRKLKDSESREMIEDSKSRVMTMGLIHEHLYKNTSFAELDFKNYAEDLILSLIDSHADIQIEASVDIPDVKINVDNAIFLGLILNELVINSIKHAYHDMDEPQLDVTMEESAGQMVLEVRNNGYVEDVDLDKPSSFGWKMIHSIAEKLNSKVEISSDNGLSVKLYFGSDIVSLK